MYQLIHKESCTDQQLYMSTLTLVIGVFIPNPVVSNSSNCVLTVVSVFVSRSRDLVVGTDKVFRLL